MVWRAQTLQIRAVVPIAAASEIVDVVDLGRESPTTGRPLADRMIIELLLSHFAPPTSRTAGPRSRTRPRGSALRARLSGRDLLAAFVAHLRRHVGHSISLRSNHRDRLGAWGTHCGHHACG
ncbi:UNVERIFIED_ORG: hypothetical protein M2328_002760 [Rhodococcus erythropolis]